MKSRYKVLLRALNIIQGTMRALAVILPLLSQFSPPQPEPTVKVEQVTVPPVEKEFKSEKPE